MSAPKTRTRLPSRYTRPPLPQPRKAAAAPISPDDSAVQALIKKRKLWVRAAAVGVGVVCFALIGAQLKTTKQEIDASKKITESAGAYTRPVEASASRISKSSDHEDPLKQQLQEEQRQEIQSTGTVSLDVARQIASLEDRKLLLNRQKNTIEAKIELLRERMAKKRELENLRNAQQVER